MQHITPDQLKSVDGGIGLGVAGMVAEMIQEQIDMWKRRIAAEHDRSTSCEHGVRP